MKEGIGRGKILGNKPVFRSVQKVNRLLQKEKS